MTDGIRRILEEHGISAQLTEEVLKLSDGGRKNPSAIAVSGLPEIDGSAVIDASRPRIAMPVAETIERLTALGLSEDKAHALVLRALSSGKENADPIHSDAPVWDEPALHSLGIFFLPLVSFGVLNGGSASSYFDDKKNAEFSPAIYRELRAFIETRRPIDAGLPKGLTPAYFLADGSPGHNFLLLKMRVWLRLLADYQKAADALPFALPWNGLERIFPMFEMSSRSTHTALKAAYAHMKESPFIQPLVLSTGISVTDVAGGIQDLIAAFTPQGPDGSRDVFLSAYGKSQNPLGLPGGHGQNFRVLGPVYRSLREAGKRFAYLGNVDNIGFYPSPCNLALHVLKGADASFEFCYRTPMDFKGGILVRRDDGILCTADIGQSISRQEVDRAEAAGKRILFNCATGLFDLNALVPSLDKIVADLPIRFSEQDKDAGRYAQAEQTTWEAIPLFAKPLILGVRKEKRFLAAKLVLDCMLTSGFGGSWENDQNISHNDRAIITAASVLHQGLKAILSGPCGLSTAGIGNA